MWKQKRREQLRSKPFSAAWRRILQVRFPLYNRLPPADRRELEGHIQVFLAEKNFEGCGGLVMTNTIKLCVAAQACLLLLRRDTDSYPGLSSILVYPGTHYSAKYLWHIGSGVLEEGNVHRAGEAHKEGAVVVSWGALRADPAIPYSGHYVVLHECTHQLDYENGLTDGVPDLGHGKSLWQRKKLYAAWTHVLGAEYEQHRARVERQEKTLLWAYGATNTIEFFAVATECFFAWPNEMEKEHPQLYEQLKGYFNQDPARWKAD